MTERTPGAAAPLATPRPMHTESLDRCLACGHERLRSLPVAYAFAGAWFPLVECLTCGMRFLSVRPDAASLADLYSAEYFDADYRCGHQQGSSFDEAAFVDEDRGLLDAFESLARPGRLLDVGCASGWLLRHAQQRGWNARGVELSKDAAAFARRQGLDVVHGDLFDAGFPAASFDFVYLGDVLEHVPDCRRVLNEVARVLAPGGLLYLRGPTTTNSLARALGLWVYAVAGRTVTLREPPYHLWEFRPRPLAWLIREVGLELVRLRQSKIPPGKPHGVKTALQRLAMNTLDAINVPITNAFNVRGDRIVLVARRPRVG